jgi:hypothetical protein
MILATSGSRDVRDGVQALALAERIARATSFQDPAALLALASAAAETGDDPAARRLLESAVVLAREGRKPELLPALEEAKRQLASQAHVRFSAADWDRYRL